VVIGRWPRPWDNGPVALCAVAVRGILTWAHPCCLRASRAVGLCETKARDPLSHPVSRGLSAELPYGYYDHHIGRYP
jgi:hypothetical protein